MFEDNFQQKIAHLANKMEEQRQITVNLNKSIKNIVIK